MLNGVVVYKGLRVGCRVKNIWRLCKIFWGDVLKRLWGSMKFTMGCLMEGLKVEKWRYLGGSGRKRSGNIEGRWDKRGQSTGNKQ